MSEIINKKNQSKEDKNKEDKQYAEMLDSREYREEVAESKNTTKSWLLRNFPPKNSTTQTQSKSDDGGRNK